MKLREFKTLLPGDKIRSKNGDDIYEVSGVGEDGWYVSIRKGKILDHIYTPGAHNWDIIERGTRWMNAKDTKHS